LDELFQQHGNVLKVRLPCDRETGKLKGFGYVQMGSLEESKSACEELNGHMFEGRSLRIDYAGERTYVFGFC
jgi:nucleolin